MKKISDIKTEVENKAKQKAIELIQNVVATEKLEEAIASLLEIMPDTLAISVAPNLEYIHITASLGSDCSADKSVELFKSDTFASLTPIESSALVTAFESFMKSCFDVDYSVNGQIVIPIEW